MASTFYPHCSHRLQPLDVSVFGAVKAYYKIQCSDWQKNNANKVLEIRHIAGILCDILDNFTPKTIKSGFVATGISPFDSDYFTDCDFVQAIERNSSEAAVDNHLGEEDQRRIVISHSDDISRQEKVSSEPSTSTAGSSLSRVSSPSSVLDVIGLLQAATPKKPSNRGREPMQSSVLTSPENIAVLKENKATKKTATTTSPKKTIKARQNLVVTTKMQIGFD